MPFVADPEIIFITTSASALPKLNWKIVIIVFLPVCSDDLFLEAQSFNTHIECLMSGLPAFQIKEGMPLSASFGRWQVSNLVAVMAISLIQGNKDSKISPRYSAANQLRLNPKQTSKKTSSRQSPRLVTMSSNPVAVCTAAISPSEVTTLCWSACHQFMMFPT